MPLNIPTSPAVISRENRIYQINAIDDINHCNDEIDINSWYEKHSERIEELPEEISTMIYNQLDVRRGQLKYNINPIIYYRFADVEHARDFLNQSLNIISSCNLKSLREWVNKNLYKIQAIDKSLTSEKDKIDGLSPGKWFLKEYDLKVASVA